MQQDLNWGGEQCQGNWEVPTNRRCGGGGGMQCHQTEQARIWYHLQPCTLPPLRCVTFPCWIIATLFAPTTPPSSRFSPSHTHTHNVWVGWGGGGTLAKCHDNSQHGSWWEIECYNGVTNLHSCESFGPLTWVAGKITSLPPKHSFSEMPL